MLHFVEITKLLLFWLHMRFSLAGIHLFIFLQALDILRVELDRAMGLLGVSSHYFEKTIIRLIKDLDIIFYTMMSIWHRIEQFNVVDGFYMNPGCYSWRAEEEGAGTNQVLSHGNCPWRGGCTPPLSVNFFWGKKCRFRRKNFRFWPRTVREGGGGSTPPFR